MSSTDSEMELFLKAANRLTACGITVTPIPGPAQVKNAPAALTSFSFKAPISMTEVVPEIMMPSASQSILSQHPSPKKGKTNPKSKIHLIRSPEVASASEEGDNPITGGPSTSNPTVENTNGNNKSSYNSGVIAPTAYLVKRGVRLSSKAIAVYTTQLNITECKGVAIVGSFLSNNRRKDAWRHGKIECPTNPPTFICKCGVSKNMKDLTEHLLYYENGRRFKCELCPKICARYCFLKHHLRKAHHIDFDEEVELGCRHCGSLFSSRGGLKNHQRCCERKKDPRDDGEFLDEVPYFVVGTTRSATAPTNKSNFVKKIPKKTTTAKKPETVTRKKKVRSNTASLTAGFDWARTASNALQNASSLENVTMEGNDDVQIGACLLMLFASSGSRAASFTATQSGSD